MRNYSGETVTGLELMLALFPKVQGVVLIEENKPGAIAAMTAACGRNAESAVNTAMAVGKGYAAAADRTAVTSPRFTAASL